MLGYMSLDIICSSELTVSIEVRSRTTARFSEQIMLTDKYPSIFPRQIEAIVYIYAGLESYTVYLWCSLFFALIFDIVRKWSEF